MALGGALALEAMGQDCPVWLVSVVSGAVGYIFGQVHENGTKAVGGTGTTPPA
jgi:NADPH-dependent curcumin reductase CurA